MLFRSKQGIELDVFGKQELVVKTSPPKIKDQDLTDIILQAAQFIQEHESLDREEFRKKYNPDPIVELEFPSEEIACRGGGAKHVCVMPSGDITFCSPVPYSYGNIESIPLRIALKKIIKDHRRFCGSKCKGQCIVNFPEYRENCNADFMYKDLS